MKVTLARAYGDHAPDETVDLPDTDALRLLADGKARLPKPTPPEPDSTDDAALSGDNKEEA